MSRPISHITLSSVFNVLLIYDCALLTKRIKLRKVQRKVCVPGREVVHVLVENQ